MLFYDFVLLSSALPSRDAYVWFYFHPFRVGWVGHKSHKYCDLMEFLIFHDFMARKLERGLVSTVSLSFKHECRKHGINL